MNFIPDAGKYEIVSFICTCYGEVNLNTPLQRVATEVVGWASYARPLVSGTTALEKERGMLPLAPVILELGGLRACPLDDPDRVNASVGGPRLAPIGVAQLAHQELIMLHRTYHEQQG
jgi:hypothetical protein